MFAVMRALHSARGEVAHRLLGTGSLSNRPRWPAAGTEARCATWPACWQGCCVLFVF